MAHLDFNGNPALTSESRLLQYNGKQDDSGLPILSLKAQDGSDLDLSVFEQCSVTGFPIPGAKYEPHPLTRANEGNQELLNILGGNSLAQALTAEVSDLIGFSRTILYTDPYWPSHMYKLGGIGVCTQDGNRIRVEQPDPGRRMGKYIEGTGNMKANIFEPEGTFTHDENNTVLGVYTTPGIVDKVLRHTSIARTLAQYGISVPNQVLIANRTNTNYYVLGTSLPLSLNFSQIGNIEAWALSEGVFHDPLLSLAGTFLRFNMLASLHDAGLTHNQFTATNARINVTNQGGNSVIPNDFTDSRRLITYPNDRYMRTKDMPYSLDFRTWATLFDFKHSLHLLFKEIRGGDGQSLSAHLLKLAGAAIAGYTNLTIDMDSLRTSADDFLEQGNIQGLGNAQDIIAQAVRTIYYP